MKDHHLRAVIAVLVLLIVFFSIMTYSAKAETGIASAYGRSEAGTKTANGERVVLGSLNAAHRTLPLGSRVMVTGPSGRSAVIRINDRGPFVRGRIIDMTPTGMSAIGCPRDGLCRVTVRPL